MSDLCKCTKSVSTLWAEMNITFSWLKDEKLKSCPSASERTVGLRQGGKNLQDLKFLLLLPVSQVKEQPWMAQIVCIFCFTAAVSASLAF